MSRTYVFDTMLFVYPAVEVETLSDEATSAFLAAEAVVAPVSMYAELAESVRKWVVAGELGATDLAPILRRARAAVRHAVPTHVVAERALELALERRHDVYDALFVAVAERYATRVVTYDRAMLARFPDLTISVPDFLASRA